MVESLYQEPFVGQTVEPHQFAVTQDMVDNYLAGLGLKDRNYLPLMIANNADIGVGLMFSQQRGHLWLRHEWEFFCRLEVGAAYSVQGRVLDIYQKRERTIILSQTELRSADDRLVSLQRHHQSFLINQPVPEVVLRDPKAKEGAQSFEVPAGQPVGMLETTITLDMCRVFFYGAATYHAEAEISRELGFRDVVVGGRMTMGYVGELLEQKLGLRWAETGRLLVKFTNVLWPGRAFE